MTKISKRVKFAMCVANEGFNDLQVWRVYPVLPDAKASGLGCLRVIDESGEDYLYPAKRFVPLDLPSVVRSRLPRWRGNGGVRSTAKVVTARVVAKSRRRLTA